MSNVWYKVLFLSDCNGFEHANPIAWLVKLSEDVDTTQLDSCAATQLGARRSGGHLNHILSELKALGINSEIIYTGRHSDFLPMEDETPLVIYNLISGNY